MAGRGTDIQLGAGVTNSADSTCSARSATKAAASIISCAVARVVREIPANRYSICRSKTISMRIFGSDRIKTWMDRMGVQADEVISHPMVNRAIATAQKRVEGQNYEVRKHLLEYDDVMNKQRTVIYGLRRRILKGEEIKDEIIARLEGASDQLVSDFAAAGTYADTWDLEKFYAEIKRAFGIDYKIPEDMLQHQTADETAQQVEDAVKERYAQIEDAVGSEQLREIERQVLLGVIDHAWREHLYAMDGLRDSTRFRGYAQKDPLQEYKKEGFAMFGGLMERTALGRDAAHSAHRSGFSHASAGGRAQGARSRTAHASGHAIQRTRRTRRWNST